MAVLAINEIAEKGGRSNGPSDSEITRTWRVITDSPFDTPLTIQPSMPVDYNTTLTGYPGFICQAVSYEFQHKGPNRSVWTATYTFKTKTIDEEELERQQFPDPLDRRCRVSVRHVRYGELTIQDRNGDIKRTSAGEIYPPKEKDATRYTFSFHKNYSIIPEWIWDLQDKVNDATVQIRGKTFDPGTLKFSLEEVPEKKIENGTKHFPIRWVLDWRRDGWKDKRVDAGFYYLSGDNLKRILDSDDEPVVVEEWLDGSGGKLRDIIPNPQPGDETINEWDDYEEADFSVMPLSEVESGAA